MARVQVEHDAVFGPIVSAGAGARLTPLTDVDAAELAEAAAPAPARPAFTDLLLRVSRLVDDLPRISALTLGPDIVEIHLAPCQEPDLYLRRLRAPSFQY